MSGQWLSLSALLALAGCVPAANGATPGGARTEPAQIDDSHVHLTNYVQEGPTAREFLRVMGDQVHRAVLFGIPLQQQWSYRISGDAGPQYYLESDAHLYYYSFTDAVIAQEYLSLSPEERARFDPMITGFNPTDMYAADQIRRVLQTYPGVFEGIGEFTIHKEFVSSKVTGDVASLTDPALDRLLDFAGEVGLVALIHNDMTFPFPKPDADLLYYDQMRDLLVRHPRTTIIWAHLGMGRVIRPVKGHAALIEALLADPRLAHVFFDISWSEVAKYLVTSDQTVEVSAALINKYPDRFLFGSDEVAPRQQEAYMAVYRQYGPLWAKLTPRARRAILKDNFERLYDAARERVRAWEHAHVAAH
jgi:predicted TIM-barrel fold metal-dependent hydrolase